MWVQGAKPCAPTIRMYLTRLRTTNKIVLDYFVEPSLCEKALLSLWLKLYRKMHFALVNEGETLAKLDISFDYPCIVRRADEKSEQPPYQPFLQRNETFVPYLLRMPRSLSHH